jgi:RNA polymerase sigma factor (sigma-70 family)
MNPIIKELIAVYGELKRWLTREMNNADDAADLAQASFERALAHAGNAEISSPRGLLFRTAINLRIDASRRRALASWESLCEIHGQQTHGDLAVERTPEQEAISRELLDRIAAAIDALPPRCRQAFVLNRIHGLSHDEVARELGISRSAVEKHVMKGLQTCRALRED